MKTETKKKTKKTRRSRGPTLAQIEKAQKDSEVFKKLCADVTDLNRSAKQRGYQTNKKTKKVVDRVTNRFRRCMRKNKTLSKLLDTLPNTGCSYNYRRGVLSFNLTKIEHDTLSSRSEFFAEQHGGSSTPGLREWFREHVQYHVGVEIRITMEAPIRSHPAPACSDERASRREQIAKLPDTEKLLTLTLWIPRPSYMFDSTHSTYRAAYTPTYTPTYTPPQHDRIREQVQSTRQLTSALLRIVRDPVFRKRAQAEADVATAIVSTLSKRLQVLADLHGFITKTLKQRR